MRCSACGSLADSAPNSSAVSTALRPAPTFSQRVAAYVLQPGDSVWRALALDVLRIEDGVIAEIVTFPPDCFLPFGLPLIRDEASEVDTCH